MRWTSWTSRLVPIRATLHCPQRPFLPTALTLLVHRLWAACLPHPQPSPILPWDLAARLRSLGPTRLRWSDAPTLLPGSPRRLAKFRFLGYFLDSRVCSSISFPSLPPLAFDACSPPTAPTGPDDRLRDCREPARADAPNRGQGLPGMQEVGRG